MFAHLFDHHVPIILKTERSLDRTATLSALRKQSEVTYIEAPEVVNRFINNS